MLSFLIVLTVFLTGAMFGTALASSIIVHPILVEVKRSTAIEVFKPFFDKTHKVVLILAAVIAVLALTVSIVSGEWSWFIVSLLMHLNGPYTLKLMMPTNRRLMDENVDPESDETKADLINWGKLHWVRTIWNGLIFLAFVILAVATST